MTRRAFQTSRLVLAAGSALSVVGVLVLGLLVLAAWLGYRRGVRRRP